MTSPMTNFYKGAHQHQRGSDALRPDDEETSIYFRWWRLMRLSPLFWYADKTKSQIVDPDAFKTHALIGDLKQRDFGKWWEKNGQRLFAEARLPRKIRVLDLINEFDFTLYEKSVVLEIPLSVSKRKIMSEFRKILNDHHYEENLSGRRQRLNVANYTTANLKLRTKKFNITTLDNEYYVLVYRILYPHTRTWQIADRLMLAPNIHVRNVDREGDSRAMKKRFQHLEAIAGRNLYKARNSRLHVEKGAFPDYSKIPEAEMIKPFGEAKNDHFRQLASEEKLADPSHLSEWQQWVQREHGPALKSKVIKMNRLEAVYDINSPEFKQKLESFMRGLINL